MALITFLKGVNQGSTVKVDGERIVLGRNADCSVVLNEPAVSREHAVIRKIQSKFYIEDLKSRNGTFVNSREVKARTLLKDKDRIKICKAAAKIAYLEKRLKLSSADCVLREGSPRREHRRAGARTRS